jgi:transposase
VLKLQRPAKTSRTSSKPPSTNRKGRCEQSRPGGAKPGHEGHSRIAIDDPDEIVDHRPTACPDCGLALSPDLPSETVSVHERIDVPEVKPVVEQHRRLAVVCPGCRARVPAPWPTGAASTLFAPRLHATAVYLKTLQALSYKPPRKALVDLFGLRISQGGLTKMLRRAETRFEAGRETAPSITRKKDPIKRLVECASAASES